MTDETGHQLPNVIYPGLDRGELVDWVERFYGEYFFRPRVVWRIVQQGDFQQRRAPAADQGSPRVHGAAQQAQEVRGRAGAAKPAPVGRQFRRLEARRMTSDTHAYGSRRWICTVDRGASNVFGDFFMKRGHA